MASFEDYYELLQVHFNAESEIIESAFKRLSKKYHPDLNKDQRAEEIMKKLNTAYEVLKNPMKRSEYDKSWAKYDSLVSINKIGSNEDAEKKKASQALNSYLELLQSNDFENAYGCLSSYDSNNITFDDFYEWQSLVSKCYEMGEFKLNVFKVKENVDINDRLFEKVIAFSIKMNEKNLIAGTVTEYEFMKEMVLEEGGSWKVLLGQKSVKPSIEKLNALIENPSLQYVMKRTVTLMESHDAAVGLPNMKGFIEEVKRETQRCQRYNRKYSILLCSINSLDDLRKKHGKNCIPDLLRQVGRVLENSLRITDHVSLWDRKVFGILLPETEEESLKNVSRKISLIMNNKAFYYETQYISLSVCIGEAEFTGNINDTIKIAYERLTQAGSSEIF